LTYIGLYTPDSILVLVSYFYGEVIGKAESGSNVILFSVLLLKKYGYVK